MKNNRKPIIGVMGPGSTDETRVLKQAEQIGKMIAEKDWVLLTGGRKAGVMDAASKGAFKAGGTVIGVLPGDSGMGMSDFVTLPIITGMGSARNIINILTADVVIVCGMGLGTASEASLALKHNKPVLFTMVHDEQLKFFSAVHKESLTAIDEPNFLIQKIESLI